MDNPLLLHGFTGSAASWAPAVVDGLASAGRAPVLLDLPGHGGSAADPDPDSFDLPAALDLIRAAGEWPDDLIGYSMGGRIALHFAAANPEKVRRLVLESASPGLASAAARRARLRADRELADRIEADGLAAFLDGWARLPLFESRDSLPPQELERVRATGLRNSPLGLARALRALGTGALPSLWDRLESIDVPTLLVVGSLDRKFVEIGERMLAALPHAELVVVEGAGHTVHLERPAEWLAAVLGFLA